jgi:hypothetical protein
VLGGAGRDGARRGTVAGAEHARYEEEASGKRTHHGRRADAEQDDLSPVAGLVGLLVEPGLLRRGEVAPPLDALGSEPELLEVAGAEPVMSNPVTRNDRCMSSSARTKFSSSA